MKARASDKFLHLYKISIEFADQGYMYDIHDLKVQIHCTSPCAIDSSINLTRPELGKLGDALILIKQRLNTEVQIPADAMED